MNWIIRALMRAMVAGVGWKLGSDAYEALKKRLKPEADRSEQESEANGAGATQTRSVDMSGSGKRPPQGTGRP